MIFTKMDDVTLEKIENDRNEEVAAGPVSPHVSRRPTDPSYYAHLSSGEVIRCHNRATAEFYIRKEAKEIGQKVHTG